MKDKFFWALLILIILLGVVVNLLENRIAKLEEQAIHFKCLEQRVSRYHDPIKITGGWFIKVDSVETEIHGMRGEINGKKY